MPLKTARRPPSRPVRRAPTAPPAERYNAAMHIQVTSRPPTHLRVASERPRPGKAEQSLASLLIDAARQAHPQAHLQHDKLALAVERFLIEARSGAFERLEALWLRLEGHLLGEALPEPTDALEQRFDAACPELQRALRQEFLERGSLGDLAEVIALQRDGTIARAGLQELALEDGPQVQVRFEDLTYPLAKSGTVYLIADPFRPPAN